MFPSKSWTRPVTDTCSFHHLIFLVQNLKVYLSF
jgi:hypothetical protein